MIFWWQFLMTIFDDIFLWQFLMTIFEKFQIFENILHFWKHFRFWEKIQIFTLSPCRLSVSLDSCLTERFNCNTVTQTTWWWLWVEKLKRAFAPTWQHLHCSAQCTLLWLIFMQRNLDELFPRKPSEIEIIF